MDYQDDVVIQNKPNFQKDIIIKNIKNNQYPIKYSL